MRTRHEGAGVVAPMPGAHQRHVVREHAADVGAGARGGHARHIVQRLWYANHVGFSRAERQARARSLSRGVLNTAGYAVLQGKQAV